jgi:hypothetical protein
MLQSLFWRTPDQTPYTRRISGVSINRAKSRNALFQKARTAIAATSPWIAATAIITCVGFAQVADDQARQAAAYRAERDALLAANAPGATITLRAATVGELANASRKMAAALDAETVIAAGKGAQR